MSPKQLELENKIKRKREEIDGLESELEAEKRRHSEAAVRKKKVSEQNPASLEFDGEQILTV